MELGSNTNEIEINMKPRVVIFVSVSALLIMAVIYWRRPVQSPVTTEKPQAIGQSNSTPSANGSVSNESLSRITPQNIGTLTSPASSSTNDARRAEMTARFVEQKNEPIEFYGMVIDQDSNALSGVNVKVTVEQVIMPVSTVPYIGPKEISVERTTGTDGRFEISGMKGEGFDLESIQKDGYEVEPTKRGFGPSGGSFENPTIFKMWSTNIHEKLIGGDKKFQIIPDGRSYFINLTDCTINESGQGDLKVWINYTNQVQDSNLHDWSAGIEVINGGLLEQVLGSPMFEAPADGYVPTFQVEQKIKGYQGGETGSHQFFLRLRNGQIYGQMTIDLYAPFNEVPGLIRLSYAINLSGSQILR